MIRSQCTNRRDETQLSSELRDADETKVWAKPDRPSERPTRCAGAVDVDRPAYGAGAAPRGAARGALVTLVPRTTEPPRGHPAPETARLAGRAIDLRILAGEVCRLYTEEYPDEAERYGAAGVAWCRHDNQHIFNWTIEAVEYGSDLDGQLRWLAGVLASRDFPIERLQRNLEIAADVASAELGERGVEIERRLRAGATAVALSGGTSDDET